MASGKVKLNCTKLMSICIFSLQSEYVYVKRMQDKKDLHTVGLVKTEQTVLSCPDNA